MRILVFFLLLAVSSAWAREIAPMPQGRFSQLDRFNLPPSPDLSHEEDRKFDEFAKRAKKGGVLRVSAPQTMDLIWPDNFRDGMQRQIAPIRHAFFEGLMLADPRGHSRTLSAHLATALVVDGSPDYTIELREGVRFSDGSEMTSEDVVNSWRFELDEVIGVGLKSYHESHFGQDVKVRAADRYRVKVRFPTVPAHGQREALYFFLQLPIVKKNPATSPTVTIPMPYIGTGPYRVESANRNTLKAVKRPDYWRNDFPRFNFSEIRVDVYLDQTARIEGFKALDIDYLIENQVEREPAIDDPSASRYYKFHMPIQSDLNKASILHMNMNRPHLNNLDFRRAMVLAMDLDGANTQLYANRRILLEAPGILSPLAPKNDLENAGLVSLARVKGRRARLSLASKLLSDAGYKLEGGTLKKDGRPVEMTILIHPANANFRIVPRFQADLRQLGIALTVRSIVDSNFMMAELNKGEIDFFPQPIPIPHSFEFLDVSDLRARFHSDFAQAKNPKSIGTNRSNLIDPQIDQIIDELERTEVSSARYRELVATLLRRVWNLVPFIPLGETNTVTIYAKNGLCLPPVLREDWEVTAFLAQTAYYGECSGPGGAKAKAK